ncbi:protein kinase [Thermoleptolyngbya sp. C42_A2020_037]|uniref:protein kinase domain-containing protein n=1 Tax=Thermoleptolyngbya sp. C42_A2020_037 TaxID=2747799 RepID=UPI0025D406ED|nr:protein kinase [Thermoleptolyngbya sp. C42_A2020_037]
MDAGASPQPSPSNSGQRAMAVVLVTDAVGYNSRMADDQEHTLSLIRRDLQKMRQLCQQFEGIVLKSLDDGLVMYFVSTDRAVNCAIEIQRSTAQLLQELPEDDVLSHRIGIHLGEVVVQANDVTGQAVTVATRLQEEAAPRGICMSQAVYDSVKSRISLSASYVGSLKLKNLQEAIQAYQITPAVPANVTPGGSPIEESELTLGTLINSRYRIQRVLGQGGFGRTYLASDEHCFGDACVLKEFVPASRTEYVVQKSRELFEREARVLYQINHPQIPRFLAWLTDRGRLFLVQEYIDGKTYGQLLQERQRRGEPPFSEAEIVQWLCDLLPVLEYLHGLNILHRDISPENIMLPNGQTHPVLIDFGLVKQTVSQILAAAGSSPGSAQASVVGKFGYSPPEQIRMGQCYPCSDLYALGVSAVVLLTGQDLSVLMEHTSLEWRWREYADVSDRLVRILERLLSEKPKDRYQTAREVLADLRALSLPEVNEDRLIEVQIDLDQSKRQRQVDEIVQSAFFQDLMQNLDRFRGSFDSLVAEPDEPNPSPEAVSFEGFNNPPAGSSPDSPPVPQVLFGISAIQPGVADDAVWRTSFPSLDANAEDFPEYAGDESIHLSPAAPDGDLLDNRLIELPAATESPFTEPPPATLHHTIEMPLADTSLPLHQPRVPALWLEACRRELAECIGPMAKLLLDSVLAKQTGLSAEALVEAIATRIPNPAQASQFRSRMQNRAIAALLDAPDPPPPPVSTDEAVSKTQLPPQEPAPGAALGETFLTQCRQALSEAIGPMAGLVLRDVVARHPNANPAELVEAIATKIPNPQAAAAFRQRLKPLM